MFLIIGSTTLDLIHSGFPQLPTPRGDEFTVDSLVFCADPVRMRFGGNGANSAYVLARLGAPVALGSAIGKDPAGDLLYRPLVDVGVDMQGLVRHPTAATSVTTVITDASQQRLAFHHAGSSHAYAPDDLPPTIRRRATAVLVASFTLFLRWRPLGFAELLRQVKAQGGITALDIGPAIGQPVTLDEIAFLLPDVDYFVCNAHELAVCTAVEETSEGIALGMAQILAAGAACAVIKQGASGALVQEGETGAPVAVPGFAIQPASTVGAGDSFNAGLLYAIEQGTDVVTAARFANGVAALVLTAQDGVLGAPTAAQVNTFLPPA
ncbi:MAG: carbohydrate kinase family protein [Caldilineaceae bacterium]|nr:carbohydrate kinase family protein [Caldilineaceae bacterium]